MSTEKAIEVWEARQRESDVSQDVSTKGASQTQGHVPKREPGKADTE